MSEYIAPIEGPVFDEVPSDGSPIAAPRLARHIITISDGHEVGVMVAGRGIPLVVVHGFSAEGFLYSQTLSRLVGMGFKVIAVDTAGHGGTSGLPYEGQNLNDYSELLGRVLDELGIKAAVLAGHSMGGRIVTQLAAIQPDRTIAVVLIDAIVGDTWDRMVYAFRFSPPLLGAVTTALMVDTAMSLPIIRNPRHAAKLAGLLIPTIAGHIKAPWRLLGPMVSILRSRSSRYALNEIARNDLDVFVLHGDRDFAVPMQTGIDASRRANGTFVKVEGAGHSWILRDPETMPAIVNQLMPGALGKACAAAVKKFGVKKNNPTVDEIEDALYDDDALIFSLTPDSNVTNMGGRHHRAAYRWTIKHPIP